MKVEIQRHDDEVNDLKLKNEEEKLTIQELEISLIKGRRRAEKCRTLAEAQSAHRAMLEKMIRNAMRQSVVYKEQLRLNQAATSTLMARLEAQIAICNSDERELHRKFKQRDELEKQIIQVPEQARKRSRTEENDALLEEKEDRTLIYMPRIKSERHFHKELRYFLEEEQKLSKAALELIEEGNTEGIREEPLKLTLETQIVERHDEPDNVMEEMTEIPKSLSNRFPIAQDTEGEEDEESRKKKGKGNVEKWLQMLLEDTEGGLDLSPRKLSEESGTRKSEEIITMLNEKYPRKEIKVLQPPKSKLKTHETEEVVEMEANKVCEEFRKSISTSGIEGVAFNPHIEKKKENLSSEADIIGNGYEARKSFGEENWKDKGVAGCESARFLRSFPSSPSMILNMRKGVYCLRKKPLAIDDDDEY